MKSLGFRVQGLVFKGSEFRVWGLEAIEAFSAKAAVANGSRGLAWCLRVSGDLVGEHESDGKPWSGKTLTP